MPSQVSLLTAPGITSIVWLRSERRKCIGEFWLVAMAVKALIAIQVGIRKSIVWRGLLQMEFRVEKREE
jgi:hypothetical protein